MAYFFVADLIAEADRDRTAHRHVFAVEGNVPLLDFAIEVETLEVEKLVVTQMRGYDVLHGGEYRFGTPRITLVPFRHHLADFLALQVFLRTAEIAGDDREFHAPRVFGDVRFRAVGERTDDDMSLVVGYQLGWHGLELAAEEHVEEEGMYHVVPMVAESDLVAAEFLGSPVNNAATQAGTQRARCLAFGNLFLDDGVGVGLDNPVFDAQAVEILRQDMFWKTGLLLVEIHGNQAEFDRCALLQGHQHIEQGVGVLAPRQANQDGVAILDHVVVADGFANAAFEEFAKFQEVVRLSHGTTDA